MSFFKKITKEFEELKASLTDGDKPKVDAGGSAQQASSTSGAHHNTGVSHQPQQQYQYQQQQQQQLPAQYHQYPPYAQHQPGSNQPPPLPTGWIAQFDNNSQRWFYVDQSTGRSQWDPPAGPHSVPSVLSQTQDSRDMHGASSHYYNQQSQGGPDPYASYGAPAAAAAAVAHHEGTEKHGDTHKESEKFEKLDKSEKTDKSDKKKKSNKNVLLAGAGGVAAGAIVASALHDSSSDSEHDHGYTHTYVPAPVVTPHHTYDTAPAPLPNHDADGDSVSSSDREDVAEARADYYEAAAKARDSDASSSDVEAAEEAREEYEEEYEEVYDD